MIERYTRPEMGRIWTDENRLSIWLKIELLATQAMVRLGEVPEADYQACVDRAPVIDAAAVKRIAEIEQTTRHDVIAFLTFVEEAVGDESRWLHLGMTSSDVLDTALAVQLAEAGQLLLDDLDLLLGALERRAKEHRHTPMIGRSHGIHAEPITFGVKLASFYDEMRRHRVRLKGALSRVSVGKVSGAMGNFAHLTPQVEAHVCRELGLGVEPAATQVVQRDRHAELFSVLAGVGASLERLAVEIRHLQRTEVREVEERFGKGQKGSSAMPHKRNPILSENVTGLARLLRGYAVAALEDVALWHERDISHSSVERVIAPDATIVLDFALVRMGRVVDGLVRCPPRAGVRGQPRRLPGPRLQPARPPGARAQGAQAPGRLRAGAARRHAHLGRGPGVQGGVPARSRAGPAPGPRGDRGRLRPRGGALADRHPLRARVRDMSRGRLRPGDRLDAEVKGLDAEGLGVAEGPAAGGGRVLRVEDGLPGERGEVMLLHLGQRLHGRLVRREGDASPDRRAPPCPRWTPASPCRVMHLAPAAQAAFKRQRVVDALAAHGLGEVLVRRDGGHRPRPRVAQPRGLRGGEGEGRPGPRRLPPGDPPGAAHGRLPPGAPGDRRGLPGPRRGLRRRRRPRRRPGPPGDCRRRLREPRQDPEALAGAARAPRGPAVATAPPCPAACATW